MTSATSLNDPFASATAGMLADSIAQWAKKRKGARDRGGADAWSQLAQIGVPAVGVPEELGGVGGGPVELATVAEISGYHLIEEPAFWLAWLPAPLLVMAGETEAARETLRRIGTGESRVCLALRERSLSRALEDCTRTSLRKSADGYALNGVKSTCYDAPFADRLLVLCRMHETEDFAVVLVDTDARGIAIETHPAFDNRVVATVTFADVAVSDSEIIAEGENAAALVQRFEHLGCLLSVAETLGCISAANAMTLEYLGTREQFGRPIGTFQALQHRMAEMAIGENELRCFTTLVAAGFDELPDRTAVLAALKVRAGEISMKVAKECLQMHGGIGMTDEYDVGRYYKRVFSNSALFGCIDEALPAIRY